MIYNTLYKTVLTFAQVIAPVYFPGNPHRLLIKCSCLLGWQGVPVAAPPPAPGSRIIDLITTVRPLSNELSKSNWIF